MKNKDWLRGEQVKVDFIEEKGLWSGRGCPKREELSCCLMVCCGTYVVKCIEPELLFTETYHSLGTS